MKQYFLLLPMLLLSVHLYGQHATDSLKHQPAEKEDFSDDWADLSHYAEKDRLLAAPRADEQRVVFLGSSIFEFWETTDPDYFRAHPDYLNRGISGQLSPQLLIRFRQDVIDLKPRAVIILAGSNDISQNKGHVTYERIMDNIKSMAELARLHHIRVILCKYLPIYDYPWRRGLHPAAKIMALNQKISDYARENGFTVLDYFTPLADERHGQQAALTKDGVHPNLAGYKVMETVTEEAIRQALSKAAAKN